MIFFLFRLLKFGWTVVNKQSHVYHQHLPPFLITDMIRQLALGHETVPWCLSAFSFPGYCVSATEIFIKSVHLPRCNRSERPAGLRSVGEIKWITEAFWETSGSLADMSSIFFFFLDRGWITFHASSHFTLLHLSHQRSRRVSLCVCVCVLVMNVQISILDLVVLRRLPWMFRSNKDALPEKIMDNLHDFHRRDYLYLYLYLICSKSMS